MKPAVLLVLAIVFALTVLCGSGAWYLALGHGQNMTNEQLTLFNNAIALFSFGMGALVGLVGGMRL